MNNESGGRLRGRDDCVYIVVYIIVVYNNNIRTCSGITEIVLYKNAFVFFFREKKEKNRIFLHIYVARISREESLTVEVLYNIVFFSPARKICTYPLLDCRYMIDVGRLIYFFIYTYI